MKNLFKTFVASVAVLLASLCAVAQEVGSTVDVVRVPVEEDVLARTIDPASPYYHPRLLGLYLSGERELSLEEYHYLYYGYAYSENYRPLEPIAAEDEVLAAMERVMANPSEENLMQVVECGLKVMESDPFSPKNLNFLVYAYGALGDTEGERRCYDRLDKVLRTIEASGSGAKESEPKHVLRFSHAADVLYARGVEIKRREVVSRTAEFIFLTQKDQYGRQGYYFDFSRVYWNKPDAPTEPKKRGWTLNNVPL